MPEIVSIRRRPGRPKGSKNKKTLLREELYQLYFKEAETLIVGELKAIVKAMVKKAKEGDVQAAKILLDRCIPARKAISHSHDIQDINITINGQPVTQSVGKTIDGETEKPLVKKH